MTYYLAHKSMELAYELFRLSEDLLFAIIDEDWNGVIVVARRLGHLSGYSILIEPFWGNPAEFFELEVKPK